MTRRIVRSCFFAAALFDNTKGAGTSMDKTSYDAGQAGSLVDLLEASLRRYAANPAFVCMDRFLTYGELDEMSQRLAAWLQSRGMARGARVAIMLPNVLQFPVTLLAVLRAGYAAVGIDPRHSAAELQQQLADAACEAIVILENHAHTLEQVLPRTPVRHVVVASSGELLGGHGFMVDFVVRHVKRQVPEFSIPQMVRFRAALTQGARMPFEAPSLRPADAAFVHGSAVVTQGEAVTGVLRQQAWAQPALERPPQVAFPTIVCALPLHHAGALGATALWGMHAGALHLLMPNPRDIRNMIQELARYPFHIFPAVDTLYDALMHDPDFQHLDFAALKACTSSTPVEQDVADRWQALTGVRIVPANTGPYNEMRDIWTDSGNSTIRRAYPRTSTGPSTGP